MVCGAEGLHHPVARCKLTHVSGVVLPGIVGVAALRESVVQRRHALESLLNFVGLLCSACDSYRYVKSARSAKEGYNVAERELGWRFVRSCRVTTDYLGGMVMFLRSLFARCFSAAAFHAC